MGVKRVIDLARSLDEGLVSRGGERLLSSNLIAGVSVNLPIYGTCKPTKVCAESCYAARNVPIGMRAAVAKQVRLLNLITEAPLVAGERLVRELRPKVRKGLRFLRWNGVGDLTLEAIECLTHVADQMPELSIWVVTRIPKLARLVPHRDNVFVQFSLDRASQRRFMEMSESPPLSGNLFYSYTEAEDEQEIPEWVLSVPVSVYYTNLYKSSAPFALGEVSCPLNGAESVKGACEACGRCWNGDAIRIRDNRRAIEGRVFSSTYAPSLFQNE